MLKNKIFLQNAFFISKANTLFFFIKKPIKNLTQISIKTQNQQKQQKIKNNQKNLQSQNPYKENQINFPLEKILKEKNEEKLSNLISKLSLYEEITEIETFLTAVEICRKTEENQITNKCRKFLYDLLIRENYK